MRRLALCATLLLRLPTTSSMSAMTNTMATKDGSYKRNASKHRRTSVEPEAGRYRLHVALACPWAAGALSTLYLKGLEDVIAVSVVHPTWQKTRDDADDAHCGWVYRSPGDAPLANPLGHGSFDCDDALAPDPSGAASIRDVYASCGDLDGPFTTPLLFDTKTNEIVSNESLDILRILNDQFDGLAKRPRVNLYPEALEEELAALNADVVYPCVNNGVYRCGFSKSQAAYDAAARDLFGALDALEATLGERRFLGGDRFTWLDLRLYHTLVRFDPVYSVYFKTNARLVKDHPNLYAFVRDVYALDAVRRSTNMKHIKTHYFTSHAHLNPYGIIPASDGPDLERPARRGPPVDLELLN
jgi:putative glutathione S-transferase